ncbi:hypothetical protein BDK51DRAFT_39117, partial [Blyttiomyces helicus]
MPARAEFDPRHARIPSQVRFFLLQISRSSRIPTMSDLRKLPAKTIKTLRSSLVITSAAQAVLELAQNAVDAGADTIEISVDLKDGILSVSDNGRGIDPEGFAILGQRYVTSKGGNWDGGSFGFRGEALASICEVAMVEITSRGNTMQTKTITLKFPVRRRRLEEVESLQTVRRALEPLALICPDVSISVLDAAKNAKVLSTRKAASPVSIFRQLFGAALAQALRNVNHAIGEYRLEGFCGATGFPTKYHQYIFVNKHCMSPNHLHKRVNEYFLQTDFARAGGDEDAPICLSVDGDQPAMKSTSRAPRLPLSVLCRVRSFNRLIIVLSTNHRNRSCDVTLEVMKSMVQFKDSSAISTLLSEGLLAFFHAAKLVAPNFRRLHSSADALGPPDRPPSPRFLDRWTPAFESVVGVKGAAAIQFSDDEFRTRALGKRGECCAAQAASKRKRVEVSADGVEYEVSRDPDTRIEYFVDGRTGNSYIEPPGAIIKPETQAPRGRIDIRSFLRTTASDAPMANLWAEDTLKKWKNPVFRGAARPTPVLRLSTVDPPARTFTEKAERAFKGPRTEELELAISKERLQNLRVISQIDAKFIACKLPKRTGTPESDLLVMVDQHAADERCRLEALLDEFKGAVATESEPECTVETIPLDSLRISLTRREAAAALRVANRFARWGIAIEPPENFYVAASAANEDADDHRVQVKIVALPRLIADRCVADPKLVRDLIVAHVHWIQEGNPPGACPRGV